MVLAHYFPPYPRSFDNVPADRDYYTTQYLSPEGESGQHHSYGGLLRDRPVPRDPLPGDDWRRQDMRVEVQQAKAAGLDGFIVDVLALDDATFRRVQDLVAAAETEQDFVVVPAVDATGDVVRASPPDVAAALAPLLSSPAAEVSRGGPLLASFAAERVPVEWWRSMLDSLTDEHQIDARFVAVLLDAATANFEQLAPVSAGFGVWGERTERRVHEQPDLAARAHQRGKFWMAPVAFQDARPRDRTFAEASNTATGRAAWDRARADADMVQVVTWNDYSESSHVAPSVRNGTAYADLTRFYARWFREGEQPAITEYRVVLTHRTQLARAVTPYDVVGNNLDGGQTPVSDRCEALVFAPAPARVRLECGAAAQEVHVPAGVQPVSADLGPGVVKVRVQRDGDSVVELTSPWVVESLPPRPDLSYAAVSNASGPIR